MEPIYAMVLGVVQGLTEFLPVSSSGHLVLFQNLFGLVHPELFFDICLHVGTLLAVCAVFRRELWSIFLTLARLPVLIKTAGGYGRLFDQNEDVRIVTLIVLGSIPTGIIGLLFHSIADALFSNVWIVGVMLLVTGALLWVTRQIQPEGRPLGRMRRKDALVIGLVQGLAILPGISRSGATISTALLMGVDRETAGRYSFLLSIPAILGALVVGYDSAAMGQSAAAIGVVLLGTAAAAVVGYVALIILLRLVKQGRLSIFAPYCWAMGGMALLLTWA